MKLIFISQVNQTKKGFIFLTLLTLTLLVIDTNCR